MKNKYFIYRLAKFILSPIFKLYYNPTIIGKENIPKEGSIIIAGNHKHLYDQCLAIISTKRIINYMVKKEYFENKKVAWFFKSVGCISVDRTKKDPRAKEQAINILKKEGAIGIFSEGTRNRTNKVLLPFKYGCVSIAQKTNSYIVPFGISGDYKFRSKNLKIVFGKPFKVNSLTLEEANKKLEEKVLSLISS